MKVTLYMLLRLTLCRSSSNDISWVNYDPLLLKANQLAEEEVVGCRAN